jgi:hypothetical protein
MEGVLDFSLPRLRRLELYFARVKMGSLTRQVVVVPITSGPSQAKGTDGSSGLPCKYYKDTLTSSFHCLPHQHYQWVSYPLYPSFVVSSFHQSIGCPLGLSFSHCVHLTFG